MLIEPAAGLRGDLQVPGDKSISHRGLLLGAVAADESVLTGFGTSDDTLATADAMRSLGAMVSIRDDTARIAGVGLHGLLEPVEPIHCGNAGTLMRLLAGLLVGQEGRFELDGDESLSQRPLDRIAEPLEAMGASVETTDGHAPLMIRGRPLEPIRYELPVASAQVKSSVLLAGLLASSGPTTVVEPIPTRDHTERLLQSMGARVQRSPGEVSVWPARRLEPLVLEVPGDFSSAAPFLVATALLAGSEVRLHGIGTNPTRTGLLSVLERMGVRVSLYNRRQSAGEPIADLEVQASELVATSVDADEIPRLVDELPLFALAAGVARGESVVRGARELRVKESDRIESVTNALRAVGIRIRPSNDGFRVQGVPTRPQGGGVVESRGDHRIAMLGAIAGLISREAVEIEGADCVSVSFPDFFTTLDSLRAG